MKTYLNLVDVAGDAADPACPRERLFLVRDHHAPVMQTPHNHIQTLSYIAFDQSRNAFPPYSRQLFFRMRLSEKLTSSAKKAVDVLHHDVEEAVFPIGQISRQALWSVVT